MEKRERGGRRWREKINAELWGFKGGQFFGVVWEDRVLRNWLPVGKIEKLLRLIDAV